MGWKRWMSNYLAGIALFSFGMCISFGFSGFLIVVGVILMLGGSLDFLLTKIRAMQSPQESGKD